MNALTEQMIAHRLHARYSLSNGLDLYSSSSAKTGIEYVTNLQSHPLHDPRSRETHPV